MLLGNLLFKYCSYDNDLIFNKQVRPSCIFTKLFVSIDFHEKKTEFKYFELTITLNVYFFHFILLCPPKCHKILESKLTV